MARTAAAETASTLATPHVLNCQRHTQAGLLQHAAALPTGHTLVPGARPVSGTVVVRDQKGSRGQDAQPVCWTYTLNCIGWQDLGGRERLADFNRAGMLAMRTAHAGKHCAARLQSHANM